jgi:vacuolar protein sorting-associated protein 29
LKSGVSGPNDAGHEGRPAKKRTCAAMRPLQKALPLLAPPPAPPPAAEPPAEPPPAAVPPAVAFPPAVPLPPAVPPADDVPPAVPPPNEPPPAPDEPAPVPTFCWQEPATQVAVRPQFVHMPPRVPHAEPLVAVMH